MGGQAVKVWRVCFEQGERLLRVRWFYSLAEGDAAAEQWCAAGGDRSVSWLEVDLRMVGAKELAGYLCEPQPVTVWRAELVTEEGQRLGARWFGSQEAAEAAGGAAVEQGVRTEVEPVTVWPSEEGFAEFLNGRGAM